MTQTADMETDGAPGIGHAAPAFCSLAGWLLRGILVTVPLLFGAVQSWAWTVYAMLAYGAFTMLLGAGAIEAPRGRWDRWGWVGVGGFLALTLFQCVPLPETVAALLSPTRVEWVRQARDLIGEGIGMITLSYAPLASFSWWALLLSYGLFFVALGSRLSDDRFLTGTLWLLLAVAVMEALYGILQALIPNMGVLWTTHVKAYMGDARGTYINRNHFAGFMEMMIPLVMGFTLSRVRWRGKVGVKRLLQSERLHQHLLMALALVLMALALMFSKSRAGITGLVLGLIVFFSLVRAGASRMPKGVWWMSGFFVMLTLLYGWQIGYQPIIDRFMLLEEGISRTDYWRDSLPLIASHPLGIGLSAFDTVFPVHHASMLSDRKAAVYLHNDVLQLVVEAGWPGAAVLMGAFVTFMAVMFRRIRAMNAERDPRRFFLAVGAFSGLTALSFHSFFDFNLQIPANAVYFVMLMAILRREARGERRGAIGKGRGARVFNAGFCKDRRDREHAAV